MQSCFTHLFYDEHTGLLESVRKKTIMLLLHLSTFLFMISV